MVVAREVDAFFKRALDPKRLERMVACESERDRLCASAAGLVMNTSPQTAEWMRQVAQEPDSYDLVHSYMLEVLLEGTNPLGRLCVEFGKFVVTRYRYASSKRALEEAAECITLGAKNIHTLAVTMLPVLSMPLPMLSANEAIRDSVFAHAGECLLSVCRRAYKAEDKVYVRHLSALKGLVTSQLGISRKLRLENEKPFPYAPVVQHSPRHVRLSRSQKLERFHDAVMEVAPCVTRYHQRIGAAQQREAKLGAPLAGLRTRSMTRENLQQMDSLPRVATLAASLADAGFALGEPLGRRSKTHTNLTALSQACETLLQRSPSLGWPRAKGYGEAQQEEWRERQNEKELLELSKREDLAVGTEDLLPIMAYALVMAQIPSVVSEMRYIETFIGDQPTAMLGTLGFCLATFQSAIQVVHILGEDPHSLLPPDCSAEGLTKATLPSEPTESSVVSGGQGRVSSVFGIPPNKSNDCSNKKSTMINTHRPQATTCQDGESALSREVQGKEEYLTRSEKSLSAGPPCAPLATGSSGDVGWHQGARSDAADCSISGLEGSLLTSCTTYSKSTPDATMSQVDSETCGGKRLFLGEGSTQGKPAAAGKTNARQPMQRFVKNPFVYLQELAQLIGRRYEPARQGESRPAGLSQVQRSESNSGRDGIEISFWGPMNMVRHSVIIHPQSFK